SFVVVLPGPDIGPDSQNNGPRTPTDPRADSRSSPGNPRSGAPSEATPSAATPSGATPSEGTPAPDPIEVHEPDTVRH
ncbi:MAG TPA: hypothetical protein VHZ02_10815, partial [Acidimicrobiales bacterium]|nr:hypothetical protein [Acidimicrobiales bacterium]